MKCDELTLMPRKSRSAKIGKFINVVFAEPLLTNRGQRIQTMKTPAPFCEGHLSLFILCERAWHYVQYNVDYYRLLILRHNNTSEKEK